MTDEPLESEIKYGVDHDGHGNVQLHLGLAQPFEIPNFEAIKLAALMLKHAGCTVKINPDGMIIRFGKDSRKERRMDA